MHGCRCVFVSSDELAAQSTLCVLTSITFMSILSRKASRKPNKSHRPPVQDSAAHAPPRSTCTCDDTHKQTQACETDPLHHMQSVRGMGHAFA